MINPHEVPAEYTELACLIGFVKRYAERVNNANVVALCERAQNGNPTAIANVCRKASLMMARIQEGGE